jgi:PAS domain S-box-containing protein
MFCIETAESRQKQNEESSRPSSDALEKNEVCSMTPGEAKALTAFSAGGNVQDSIFREMVEALPVAIYTTDADGRLTYFNEAAVRLSGRVPQLGADQWCITWKVFLADGSPFPHDECPMAMALKGVEVTAGTECIAKRPDGTQFWFSSCPAVVRDDQGHIIGGINLLMDITDRKTAEIEVSDHFRAVVETIPGSVTMTAPDGRLLFINSAGLDMIGAASAEQLTGKSIYDLVAPEDRARFQEMNDRVCRGEKVSMEFDIIGLAGRRRHMETYATPLRRVDGTTVDLAIILDITERRHAERDALLLSAIVDSSDDAIISKNLDGIITSWNKSAERLFGYTAAEAIGQSVAALLIPEDRHEEESDILARLRRGERVDHFETVRRRKDGALLDISLTISPVKDVHGRIIGASKIARDITERKRAEAALTESEARFRQLADSMPQIVWTACPDGYVDYYNERWYELTGFGREALGCWSWESVLDPEDIPRAREAYYSSIGSGEPYNIEYRLWDRKENRFRWFVARALPARDARGKIVKWFGTCTDIDGQKRIEDELRRANQDLEQFAFSASHDLQEPLRIVKIYCDLLTNRYGDGMDDEARKFARYVRNGASRMETLVRDLLSYTRATKVEEPVETANATKALDAALLNLASAISETGADVSAEPLPSVPVHPTHLQQLFQNLIGNAIKYRSPAQRPVIQVKAAREDRHWLFSISDNGIGIDPQYKEIIFGLFKRLHSADEYSGTGIGLAICKRIVDRYHGRIWVESEPLRGSTFRFTLPV